MEDAVILSGVRTPIGAFLGSLSSLSAPQLGAITIKEAVKRAGVEPAEVDEVIMGCVLTGGMGQAPARQAALYGGLPNSVPCMTINKVCGSGMKSVMLAAQSLRLGESRIVVAGGMESMSNAPYAMDKARTGFRMGHGAVLDTMIYDGLWDPYNNVHMGNCGDLCARECNYTRAQIDDYAAESYRRALAAQKGGRFNEEIVPVAVPQRKGESVLVHLDEEPAKGNPEKLASLRPAFGKDGVTTAGNASSIDDGAAALVLASRSEAEKRRLKPLARIVAYATYAQDPQWFTTAPVFAVQKLLATNHINVGDVDLFEVNEAFSVVAMVTADKVGIPRDKLNVNGGAVALGHPIGMTGARLILTALHELRRRGGRYALATPCIGGGEATAMLIEAL
ncbi:MAG: thiolase family protein [Acidobacteriia bacterium]|nr:thiolase family protein [Terriglobia bacterium]